MKVSCWGIDIPGREVVGIGDTFDEGVSSCAQAALSGMRERIVELTAKYKTAKALLPAEAPVPPRQAPVPPLAPEPGGRALVVDILEKQRQFEADKAERTESLRAIAAREAGVAPASKDDFGRASPGMVEAAASPSPKERPAYQGEAPRPEELFGHARGTGDDVSYEKIMRWIGQINSEERMAGVKAAFLRMQETYSVEQRRQARNALNGVALRMGLGPV